MFRRISVAVIAVTATVLTAAPASAAPGLLPSSCAEIRAALPVAGDGNYVLVTESRILPVYCHDMAGTPREYVTLNAQNFSQYTAGGASPGSDVRTTFSKVRIDPATLTVDIADLTFATSTGQLRHGGDTVTAMPYGVAMACTGGPSGVGRVDLTGTAFVLADTFVIGGNGPSGEAVERADGRAADLTGGGFCGWINPAPVLYNPYNPSAPTYRLELACGPYNALDVLLGRACVNLP
ncbi:GON domain-containing protein [Actinophytocola sp. KF-1]